MSVMKQQHTIDGTCLPLPEKGAKEGENNPSTGLTPDALPEVPQPVLAENSQTGVSTKNAQPVTDVKTPLKTIKRKPKEVPHWYALRVTYGREKKAYDYLVGKHVEAYYPTIKTVKELVERLRGEGWTFSYMGANQDSVEVAMNLSIRNSRNFAYSHEGTRASMGKDTSTRMNFFSRLSCMKMQEADGCAAPMSAEERHNLYTCMADEAFDEEEGK